MRALVEIGALLTKEQQARHLNSLEHALEVADFISDGAPKHGDIGSSEDSTC